MTKIFLLTAPFDEDARTGDGQYAKSLEIGFARHYSTIPIAIESTGKII
jgi:effector protein SidI